MKHDTQNPLIVAPREEREIIDEIRNDHDLIERLKITAEELDALSKCTLFGTLTCKQDMLFILRQIREATSRATGQPTLFPGPARIEDQEEDDPLPDFRHIPVRIAPAIIAEPASLDGIIRRRQLEYFGVFFWVLVLFAGLAWTGRDRVVAMACQLLHQHRNARLPGSCLGRVVSSSQPARRSSKLGNSVRVRHCGCDVPQIPRRSPPPQIASLSGRWLGVTEMSRARDFGSGNRAVSSVLEYGGCSAVRGWHSRRADAGLVVKP